MSVHKIEIVGTMVNSLLIMSRDGKGNYRCKCQICGREFLKKASSVRKGLAMCFCKYLTQQV
nr:MAG TPA: C2H2 type zinc-finger protein [Caudoviricetes sp.]